MQHTNPMHSPTLAPDLLRFRLSCLACAAGVAGWLTYAAIAACFGEIYAGYGAVDVGSLLLLALLGFGITLHILVRLGRRGSRLPEASVGLALALWISLGGLLCMDAVYAAYLERSAPQPPLDDRHFDSHFAAGEFYPPLYYPTERNFRLHRANMTVSGSHYGDAYSAHMLQSPTLREQVLSLKRVDIRIDEHGLRESRALDGAHIVALGDSFTFGWGMAEERTWVRQLERRLGQRVLNFGMHDGSPKQQLELLKYFLSKLGGRLPLQHLVWLFYEGNDLEDNYDEYAPTPKQHEWQRGVGPLLHTLFLNLKDNMVIEQFRRGRVQMAGPARHGADPHLSVDGVALAVPLYRSAALGPALFFSAFIERAGLPESYVTEHENRPRLDHAFADMMQLARQHHFTVTVAVAPTGARLHGRYFDDFPPQSAGPHFIDYVATLARRHGAGFINLYELFADQAGQNMLYFRDDDHWNESGHDLAAAMIARYGFGNVSAPTPPGARASRPPGGQDDRDPRGG